MVESYADAMGTESELLSNVLRSAVCAIAYRDDRRPMVVESTDETVQLQPTESDLKSADDVRYVPR